MAAGRKPARAHLAEQAAERAGEQQRPGAGLHALARHVDQRDLEPVAVGGAARHDEVAGERVAVRRLERDLGVPRRGQLGQLALGAQPVAQVDEHRLTRVPWTPSRARDGHSADIMTTMMATVTTCAAEAAASLRRGSGHRAI